MRSINPGTPLPGRDDGRADGTAVVLDGLPRLSDGDDNDGSVPDRLRRSRSDADVTTTMAMGVCPLAQTASPRTHTRALRNATALSAQHLYHSPRQGSSYRCLVRARRKSVPVGLIVISLCRSEPAASATQRMVWPGLGWSILPL